MRFIIATILISTALGFGQSRFSSPSVIAGLAPESATAAPPYILSEGFEGAGTPAGWVKAGNAEPDCTDPVIEGTQSLLLQGTAPSYCRTNWTSAYSEMWAYMLVRLTNLPSSTTSILRLYNDGGTQVQGYIQCATDGRIGVVGVENTGAVYTTGKMGTGTNYSLWVHCQIVGAGSSTLQAGFTNAPTTEVTGGSNYASKTTCNSSNNVARLYLFADNSDAVVIDHVRVRVDQTCGNNPP